VRQRAEMQRAVELSAMGNASGPFAAHPHSHLPTLDRACRSVIMESVTNVHLSVKSGNICRIVRR